MFKKTTKTDKSVKKLLARKKNKIAYDEHFTSATASIDLAKSTKFVDIGDGISQKKESELDRLTK